MPDKGKVPSYILGGIGCSKPFDSKEELIRYVQENPRDDYQYFEIREIEIEELKKYPPNRHHMGC